VIGAAIMVARIATGEITDNPTPAERAALSIKRAKAGKKGAQTRANALTPERRTQIAKRAAATRWKHQAPVKD
jgi:hypothetical protein